MEVNTWSVVYNLENVCLKNKKGLNEQRTKQKFTLKDTSGNKLYKTQVLVLTGYGT